MKKTILLGLVSVSFLFSNAQITFGVEVGGALSGMLWAEDYQYSTEVFDTDAKFGFLAGVSVDFPINKNQFINASAGFRNLGTTVNNVNWENVEAQPDSFQLEALAVNTNNLYLFINLNNTSLNPSSNNRTPP